MVKKFEINYRQETGEIPTLINFVDYLDLMIEAGDNPAQAEIEDIDTINLLTVHASKGLEFPVVFICGLEEGLLPYEHTSSCSTPQSINQLEEERRLFYVAMTRAQDEVILLSARNRRRYNQIKPTRPSLFLNEIPNTLITRSKKPSETRSRQLRLW